MLASAILLRIKKPQLMKCIEKSKEKDTQLFGEGTGGVRATDPGFQDILSHFIFGKVFYQGNLDDKMRELIGNSY